VLTLTILAFDTLGRALSSVLEGRDALVARPVPGSP
jgi:hypothetical protein